MSMQPLEPEDLRALNQWAQHFADELISKCAYSELSELHRLLADFYMIGEMSFTDSNEAKWLWENWCLVGYAVGNRRHSGNRTSDLEILDALKMIQHFVDLNDLNAAFEFSLEHPLKIPPEWKARARTRE